MNLDQQSHNTTVENKRLNRIEILGVFLAIAAYISPILFWLILHQADISSAMEESEILSRVPRSSICVLVDRSFPEQRQLALEQELSYQEMLERVNYILNYWESPESHDSEQYNLAVTEIWPALELSELMYHEYYWGYDDQDPAIVEALHITRRLSDNYLGMAKNNLWYGLRSTRYLFYLKKGIEYYENFGVMVGFHAEVSVVWVPDNFTVDDTETLTYPDIFLGVSNVSPQQYIGEHTGFLNCVE